MERDKDGYESTAYGTLPCEDYYHRQLPHDLPDHEEIRGGELRGDEPPKKFWGIVIALIVVGLIMVIGAIANAQDVRTCTTRQILVDNLQKNHQASQVAIGLIDKKTMMEVFVNEEGKWIMFTTRIEDRISCYFSGGQGWRMTQELKRGTRL